MSFELKKACLMSGLISKMLELVFLSMNVGLLLRKSKSSDRNVKKGLNILMALEALVVELSEKMGMTFSVMIHMPSRLS